MRPTIKQFGDRAILLEWSQQIDPDIHGYVMRWNHYLRDNFSNDILNIVPAYAAVAVYLHAHVEIKDMIQKISGMDLSNAVGETTDYWHFTLPVCYSDDMAPDLQMVSTQLNLTRDEIVQLHTRPSYRVYFIGFLPGFPYLGGLDTQLHLARKNTPRQRVPRGSVGIGGQQTGIYPQDSPGGWNLIGHCPVPLFDWVKENPCLLQPGDEVSFRSVTSEEHMEITEKIEQGSYTIDKIRIHD